MRAAGQHAGRAGLGVLLALVLTSAMFAAPLLAAQTDFGHTHPESTPHHLHTLHAVLGAGTLSAPVQAAPPTKVSVVREPLATPLLPAFRRTHSSRAPPADG